MSNNVAGLLSVIFDVHHGGDMRVGMFLRSAFDFCQFLLIFCDKIFDIELLHHIGINNFDGTQLRDLEVSVLWWPFKIPSKFP